MKTLTLEHLAPYLPYGLEWQIVSRGNFTTSQNEVKKEQMTIANISLFLAKKVYKRVSCKPILRPLSDLTKEIEHNGEKVNVQYLIDEIRLGVETYEYIDSTYDIELNIETADYSQSIDLFEGYRMVEILLKYHFDVFGLINKGLAIDINTLEK